VEEDVQGLEVPVQDVEGHEDLKSVDNLRDYVQGFLLREGPFLLEQILHVSRVAVLVDEVNIVGCAQDRDEADDVLMIDLLQHRDFVHRKLVQLRVLFEFLVFYDFDGKFLVGFQVIGSVDLSEGSAADLLF